ncbi:EGF and laminin G domain-containing protein-like [Ciona intestinalis]
MLVLCLWIVVIIAEQVPTAVSNQHHCKGYTVVQNFGPDAEPTLTQNHTRGAPGKVGKKGPKGDIGERGAKGDAGITPHYNEINLLKQQVAQLIKRIDMMGPPKSCEHLNGTQDDSGIYQIQPGSRPFAAYCSFNGSNRYTRIGHDAESEIQVTSCETPLCYKRNIAYEVPMPQILSLITVSRHCRQFVKYRCRASILNSAGTRYAGWKSPDGVNRHNWGGTSRTGWCACGETGTCLDRSHKCNCDENSAATADEGYLTNKALLPVTAVMFGDAGDPGEAGWHTVGPLECWGRN